MQKRIISYIVLGLLVFIGVISFIFRKEIINAYKWHRVNYDNKEVYDKVFNDYVEQKYGIISKKFKVKYLGVGINNAILEKDKEDNFSMIYDVKIPIMKNKFRITIGYDTLNVLKDNFTTVIATDPKFQHLYSEWVKKQIGIDDENVELEFSFGGIDFTNIKHLSENMQEVFENTSMHCKDVCVYNLRDLDYDNSYSYAMKYKEIIANPTIDLTGVPRGGMTTWIHLYSVDEYSDEQYYFKFKSDNPNELVRSKV